MHSLIVTAHPSSKGHTHLIATTYAEALEKQGHTTKTINLYSPEWKQEYLHFENIRELQTDSITKKSQAEITKADEIVLVHPLWWFYVPGIMKNWFDHTFASGFAFKYDKTGKQHKLLKGKTGRVFTTAGGPAWIYFFAKPFVTFSIKMGLFGFCGVKTLSYDIIANMDTPHPPSNEQIVQRVLKRT